VNIDVDLNKVADILGDRIKELEMENALLKAALNQTTREMEQERIERMAQMTIPLPDSGQNHGGPPQTVFDGSDVIRSVSGDEKTGWYPDPNLPSGQGISHTA
jgi:hypothetical protein